jgi:hypothetical protein
MLDCMTMAKRCRAPGRLAAHVVVLRDLLARPYASFIEDWVAVDFVECATYVPGRAGLYMLDPSLCAFIVVCVGAVYLNPSLSSLHLVLHPEAPLVPGLRGTESHRRYRTAQSRHCLRLGRQA